MTTSFETSLRMKDVGFPQDGGEYYYFEDINALGFSCGTFSAASFESKRFKEYDVVCRAFTLGELVRMMGDDFNRFMCVENNKWTVAFLFPYEFFDTPEEAAAELAIELVGSGVIKFETNQKEV